MTLKLYVDRMSQPSRAILIFCRANGIDFEEVKIDLASGQHLSPEYQEINPLKQVPAIDHEGFKLFESHAILKYLASSYPEVADNWYPSDVHKRAEINSVLDWHHSNLRRGAATFVLNIALAPALGIPKNLEAAAEAEKRLLASLKTIDSFWLKENGPFLLGIPQPSIADLSLVCEIMQLQVLDEDTRERILSPYKRVLKWIDDTKNATQPHFDEIHAIVFKVREMLPQMQSTKTSGNTASQSEV